MAEIRRITHDEWNAALLRNDPGELNQLVRSHEAWMRIASAKAPVCMNRWGGTEEHVIVYMPALRAYAPGHVYSTDGLQEATKSQTCEFCYDHHALQLVRDGLVSDEKKGE
jgi:hypothetical protein